MTLVPFIFNYLFYTMHRSLESTSAHEPHYYSLSKYFSFYSKQ